jgi:hypothetical protein
MLDETTLQVWKEDVDLLAEKQEKLHLNICHGRVANLEQRVPDQWWKTVFSDSMYLKTDGDVVEDPEITRDEIQEIVDTIPKVKNILEKSISL